MSCIQWQVEIKARQQFVTVIFFFKRHKMATLAEAFDLMFCRIWCTPFSSCLAFTCLSSYIPSLVSFCCFDYFFSELFEHFLVACQNSLTFSLCNSRLSPVTDKREFISIQYFLFFIFLFLFYPRWDEKTNI